MAKELNRIEVQVTANTAQAKQQIQQLQSMLNNIMKPNTSNNFGLTTEIQNATKAAAQLSVQLQNATTKSGTLDLSKFVDQMNRSGMKLSDYRTQFAQLGTAGNQAFAQLARSITTAEMPVRRMSTTVNQLWTTLKNTARFQISSSVIHGIMGAMSTAMNYAKNLNESLNNIRIVTGQSVDQMARFAEEANKAAKNLSTTTTAYTNASLIYYQQGK